MTDPERLIITDERIPLDWRVMKYGAVGFELTMWCGFGAGRNLYHAYLRLGIVTLYASRFRLDRVFAMWTAARNQLAALFARSGR